MRNFYSAAFVNWEIGEELKGGGGGKEKGGIGMSGGGVGVEQLLRSILWLPRIDPKHFWCST